MKLAILSDIHGNAVALEEVLHEVKKQGIQRILIAGDFVGYYYDHKKVFNLLDGFHWEGVRGNHDEALQSFLSANQEEMEKYRSSFGHSLDIAISSLTKEQLEMIVSLPNKRELEIGGKKILLCHGSPFNKDEYVYLDAKEEIFKRIDELGYDIVIMGHTHYPFTKKESKTLIINPGSVGQPRDVGNKASFAILDLATNEVTIHRIEFPHQQMIEQIGKIDPNIPYLKDIFKRNLNGKN